MSRFSNAVLLGCLALTGCDAAMTDPNVARINAASITESPAESQGRPLFVRLITSARTTDTAAGTGPFPLTLASLTAADVAASGGPFEGESLVVELRRCGSTCATSDVLGRTTAEPSVWSGSERSVVVGGVTVKLVFQRTTS